MAWRKWPEIRGYTDEQRVGWLVSVAARKAIDTFRRNETERTHAMAVYEHHRPAEHDVHSQSLTSMAVARFSRVISEMPPARSRVAYLYWRCGWKQQEIAQELGLARATVCEHVRAARATLERELGPYVPFDSWVAVRHAADHIHLVAMLARQDGTRPRLWNDYYQVGEACRAAEQRFGLRQTAPRDRTAARRPTRAESEKARRHGFHEAPRVALRRAVSTAAAGAASEQEFFARLDRAGVLVRKRFSTRNPGQVTGYAVALTGDTAREGGPVWFGGGKLAADLTLPKLRCRWDPARTQAAEGFTAAERNAIWEHAARTADAAARNIRFTGPDDPAVADAAWAAADTLHAAAAALGSRVLRQAADSFDRAARAPYGRVPPVVARDGIGLRRSARLLSLAASAGDETVQAQMRLVLQLSRLARAVAELREAQRHAAQAAAARQAAGELRAAWRASTSWPPEELASARTAAERVRLDFPIPPGPARPGTGPQAGAHRSGPRPSYRPPAPSRRGPGR